MNNNLLYTVEDKPPFGLSLLLAAQHLLAALGGIIAVPLVSQQIGRASCRERV